MAGRRPLSDAPPFGQRLAALRKTRGLSQEQLAKLMGKTREAIDYYERRAKNPTSELLKLAADAFNVPVAELMDQERAAKGLQKPGPPSRFEQLTRRLSALPKTKQKLVAEMLEGVLRQHETSSGS